MNTGSQNQAAAQGEYEVAVKVAGEDNKASYTSKTTKIKIRISKK